MQNDQETLSTAIDGETGNRDHAMLQRIAADPDARATWARYHLIGDVMRDNLTEVAPTGFSTRLRNEITSEPTVLAPRQRQRSRLRPVMGLAIAASVAALAVVGIKQLTPENSLHSAPDIVVTTSALSNADQLAVLARPPEAQPIIDRSNETTRPSQRRLNSYLVKFNAQRSSLAVPGVNPYVRIVGFQSD